MRLDEFLAHGGMVRSRSHAKDVIIRGCVQVRGVVVTKPSKQVSPADDVTVTALDEYVGRGGRKLEGALISEFGTSEDAAVKMSGASVLDIGSSTGGFTECCLRYGATRVDAVDVGTGQFSEHLMNTYLGAITLYEETDIRVFTGGTYEVVVGDVSFISLAQLLPDVLRFMRTGSWCMLLIKPQFEVGAGKTKKGIVKDEEAVALAIAQVTDTAARLGLTMINVHPCVITGGDGNQEYFMYGVLE